MTDPILEEIDRLVAELPEEVYVAVRVTSDGHVAFMGTFASREAAEYRCQSNTSMTLKWETRGRDGIEVGQWHTQIVPFGNEKTIRYSIAKQEIT